MHLLAWAPRCSCKKSTTHSRLPDSTVSTSTPSNSRYGHCIDGPCIDVKCAVDDTNTPRRASCCRLHTAEVFRQLMHDAREIDPRAVDSVASPALYE